VNGSMGRYEVKKKAEKPCPVHDGSWIGKKTEREERDRARDHLLWEDRFQLLRRFGKGGKDYESRKKGVAEDASRRGG